MHDRFFPFIVVLVLALLAFVSSGRCEVGEVSHELTVRLLPEERMLEGVHRMRFSAPEEAKAGFFLNSDAGIISIEVNGRPGEYVYSSGRGEILLPEGRNIVDVVIRYEGTFDDPFQARPLSMDNPGFGVTGTIFEQGAFLPAGSGWYPLVDAKRETFRLTVSAPRGMQAVSAGRLESIRDEKDSTISIWDVENPVRGLSLSAGYYFMDRSRADGNRIYTFFSPGLKRLSPLYLRKTAEHISFFEKLHGPYAFPKFAVVENFFPTGYGFPSYTLLGASVLRLPFIPETSLRHEVAHCWWGNGVLVDYDQGNWSEGLSTYVSDYLSKELSSREEAREYRVQVLRDYALLAAGEEDIPLSRFAGRQDPATRTVGYGKAMFVFHMARQRMGDGSFWTALEEIYRTRLFKETSWRAFAESFAANSHWTGKEADRFFDQWVTRTGAPILGLDNVSMVHEGDTWGVKGTLLQEKPLYDLEVPVVLETEHGSQKQSVNIAGRSRSFSFNIKSRPVRLTVDPESHVFRLLNGEEIPATINTVKGAQTLTVVVSSNFDRKWLPLVKSLLIVLNQEGAPVVSEQDLGGVPKGNLLFVGYPENQSLGKLLSRLPESSFSSKGFLFQGYAGEAGDGLFASLKENGRVSALFLPEEGSSLEEVEEMIRKITHYGTYSYLVFKQTEVAAKGRWEPESSPLTIELGEMQ